MSQRSYLGDRETSITFYRNSKGSMIHLVMENKKELCPLKIFDSEKWDSRDYEILKAFEKKAGKENKKISLLALAGGRWRLKKPKIEVYPYEANGVINC